MAMSDIARLREAARESERLGDMPEAQALLEQAVAIAPQDAKLWTWLGYIRSDRQLYAQAITAFERSLEIDHSNPAAHTGISDPLAKIGRTAEALEHLLAAIEADRKAPRLLLVGDLQMQLGLTLDAIESFRSAVQLEPDNAEALYNLARAVKGTDSTEAKALLTSAVKADPLYANAYRELASVFAADGAYADAEDALRTAIHLNPADPWAHLQLANVLWSLGVHTEAESAFEEAGRLAPLWSRPRYALGEFLEWQGDPQRAERAYREAVQVEPSDVEAVFRLAAFLIRTGTREEGCRLLRQARGIDPTHVGVASLLTRLEG